MEIRDFERTEMSTIPDSNLFDLKFHVTLRTSEMFKKKKKKKKSKG